MKILKRLFLGMILSFTSLALGVELRALNIKSCDHWRSTSDGRGYLCSGWPNSIYVADADTYENAIRKLENRVAELEQKLEKMSTCQSE